MNPAHFPNGACEKAMRVLDFYLDNELQGEDQNEMLRHLDTCPGCSRELDARAGLKAGVRRAANQVLPPADLELKIQTAIRDYEQHRVAARTRYWLISAAAAVLLAFVAWRASTFSSGRNQLANFLRIGVADHEGCAVPRTYAGWPPSQEQMRTDLGPVFQDLLPVVRHQMPPEFRLEQAHRCVVAGREYVHFIFRKAPVLVSFIVTKKEPADRFARSFNSVDQTPIDKYQAAGAELNDYLFYVVSNMPPERNRQLAVAFSAPLRDYLSSHWARAAGFWWPPALKHPE